MAQVIPDFHFSPPPPPAGPGGSTPRTTLNDAAKPAQKVQVTAAAVGDLEAIVYGEQRIGAKIGFPIVYQNNLLLPCFIGKGPIDAITALEMDNVAAPGGVTRTDYLGAASQTANADLVAAWAAKGRTYTDAHNGVAYSVVKVPAGAQYGFSNIAFLVRGKKVYDPRDVGQTEGDPSTWLYSDNPALCLADLISSTAYGLGEPVDWDSFAAVADVCDEVVGVAPNTEARRRIGLTINAQKKTRDWVEVLRSYAGCYLTQVDGKWYAVADEPAASMLALTSSKYVLDSIGLRVKGPEDSPTVVTVKHTDTSSRPWNTQASQTYKLTGVDAGTIPYRESVIEWPGCPSAGMAYREAYRRAKQAQLSDLEVDITLTDEALKLYRGLVVTLTDSEGFSGKAFRVLDVNNDDPGRPRAKLGEYDSAVYTNTVVTGPSTPDTDLPSPASPDPVTGLTLAEELYQAQGSGLFHSRITASWTAPDYPFIREYRVEVTKAGVLQQTDTVRASLTSWKSVALEENTTYAVNVYVISTIGAVSAVTQGTVQLLGKDDVPSDVTDFIGREVGGRVFFEWGLIADLDNDGYEIRYGLQSAVPTWDTAELLDSVSPGSNRYVADGIPAGDYTFFIKAKDGKRTASYPKGQYSANAATFNLTITLDTALFLTERNVFTSETLSNMSQYTVRPIAATYSVTDFGDALAFGHSDTNNATGTFADLLSSPFCLPHSSPSPNQSQYTTNAYDFGLAITATWRLEFDLIVHSATSPPPDPSYEVLVSTDGVNYTPHAGVQWTGEARFVKGRVTLTGAGAMLVTRDAQYPAVAIDAVARVEDGEVTTSAVAATTVTLAGHYSRVKSIQLTVGGSEAAAYWDNVVIHATNDNTFDIYAFDALGNQVAADVSWTFKGV